MIDFLKGTIAYVEAEYIVLDVQDVGYRVFTANPYAFAAKGEKITVYIHHHVREDAELLFGFATREEQGLFRKLIEVSGIGPRVALGILGGGRPQAVIAAIQQEDIAFLVRLPGIGKKTAQRMILDLKEKLGAMAEAGGAELASLGLLADAGEPTDGLEPAWREAREGLIALGYTQSELDRAWNVLKGKLAGTETVDVLMKQALQQLFKG